jgi:putative SOS response-associated peptidase YedK
MCGRFTLNYTWQQIQALRRPTVSAAIPNFQPRLNVCPTDPAVLCTSSMIKKLCSEKKKPDKIVEGQKWGGHHEKHHGSISNHAAADS